jgi:phosphatidylserine/phosphatidylglycerophosphate/cardiolipin synthase-like enzyme
VIDNKIVITGSFNWSPAAAHINDETLLVIESPKVAAHFTHEMNRMWRSAELRVTPRIQRKLERQRAKRGSKITKNQMATKVTYKVTRKANITSKLQSVIKN